MSKFENLLYEFEESSVSKKQIDRLISFFKNDNLYKPLFDSYVSRRLHNNIHPERLLNMAYNMEKHEATKYLSEAINDRIADSIILKDESYDQFYFMYRHDTRDEYHVFKTLLSKLGDRLDDNVIKVINTIAPVIKRDKFDLIIEALGTFEFGNFRTMLFMDRLSAEEQYLLVSKALEKESITGLRMLRLSNSNLKNEIHKKVDNDGDQSIFATALRNTLIPIDTLESNEFINFIISTYGDKMPATLGRLYVRAEKESRYEYLITLGKHKNKKDVLRTICKANDKKLIDRFFSIYKNSPEVKHLVPFL